LPEIDAANQNKTATEQLTQGVKRFSGLKIVGQNEEVEHQERFKKNATDALEQF